MRKGTFSVQKANPNSAKHNSRELSPKYLIDTSAKNYYELITTDSEFKNIAQTIYKEKIKQTMQKKQVENLIQETVLTLQPNQNEKDIKELFKKLNKKYGGHELLEVAIHRDEGYFLKDDIAYYPTKNILNKDGVWYVCSDTSIKKPKVNDFDTKVDINEFEKVYNYHAHAKFSMFDRELGKSARMQKKDMSERIKFVSAELGLLFAPDKETRFIKKNVNQIKDEHLARARVKEQELAKTKDLQEINKQLRSELKEVGASRPDYAQLEALNKELKDKIKAKDLTIDELNEKIEELKKDIFHPTIKMTDDTPAKHKEVANYYKRENKELEEKVNTLETQNKSLQEQNKALTIENLDLKDKIVSSQDMIKSLEQKLKNILSFANEKIKSLFQFKAYNDYKFKTSDRYKYNQFMNSKKEDYWEELVYDNPELDKHYNENLDSELIKLEDIELIKLDDIDLKEDKKLEDKKESKEIELKEIKEEVKENKENIVDFSLPLNR